jgi:hypothetical protein
MFKRFLIRLCVLLGAAFHPAFCHSGFFGAIDQKTTFPVGQAASAGTSINLRNGQTSTSMLGEIADYDGMIALWWGGTRVNQTDANFTDTFKMGLNLSWVFSHFTNPLPPSGQWLKNINLGPSFAMNLTGSPHVGTPFFDVNYVFQSIIP